MKALSYIFVLLAAAFLLAACSGTQNAATADGNQAPAFDLVDLAGESHDLSQYAGEGVYIKFWASWCSICLAGMDELNALAGEETDFTVLTIVSPGANAEKNTESFTHWFEGLENTENIRVLLDEGGASFEDYGIIGFPTSIFISSDGEFVKRVQGHVGNDQIKEEFESIQ
ncbi:MAG TPA: redoxin family protein [Planococcus sp. (in: firmicutes)]|nr:redoxin family protein [Planococcus sp. (in: firmicutes)]